MRRTRAHTLCATLASLTLCRVYRAPQLGPGPEVFCDPPPGSPSTDRVFCEEADDEHSGLGTVYQADANKWLVPAGADLFVYSRVDNVEDGPNARNFSGSLISMRQYLIAKPPSKGGAALQPAWDVSARRRALPHTLI